MEKICNFNNVLTFFDIVMSHINTNYSRSNSKASKVVSQCQIVSSNPNAATLLMVELFVSGSYRKASSQRTSEAFQTIKLSEAFRQSKYQFCIII